MVSETGKTAFVDGSKRRKQAANPEGLEGRERCNFGVNPKKFGGGMNQPERIRNLGGDGAIANRWRRQLTKIQRSERC